MEPFENRVMEQSREEDNVAAWEGGRCRSLDDKSGMEVAVAMVVLASMQDLPKMTTPGVSRWEGASEGKKKKEKNSFVRSRVDRPCDSCPSETQKSWRYRAGHRERS